MNAGDFFPWMVQKVLAGETVTISKMTDLPPEADRDRESFRAYGTKSDVLVPLSVGEGPVFGLLTFAVMREERSWPETVVTGFKLIAQVFANALARRQADTERKRMEESTPGAPAGDRRAQATTRKREYLSAGGGQTPGGAYGHRGAKRGDEEGPDPGGAGSRNGLHGSPPGGNRAPEKNCWPGPSTA